jgi:mRNA interferase MazF
VPGAYVPERGDVVWLKRAPRAARRPALVISPRAYNRKVGLALACPITSRVKGYPFEVLLPEGIEAKGAVLCDQIKSLDWRTRSAIRFCTAPEEVLREATARILALVDSGVTGKRTS